MSKASGPKRPTWRQLTTLRQLSRDISSVSARDLRVRSDVLWRMEERGWVTRNAHQQWRITAAGKRALDDETARRVEATS